MKSLFRLSFELLVSLIGYGALLAQEALILPPAGDPIVVSVEDRRVYQALYSNDLENWNSLGDVYKRQPLETCSFLPCLCRGNFPVTNQDSYD